MTAGAANFSVKELLIALHILNDGHVTLNKFKGEWAGAAGIRNFYLLAGKICRRL